MSRLIDLLTFFIPFIGLFIDHVLISLADGNNQNINFLINYFVDKAVSTRSKFDLVMIFDDSKLATVYMRAFESLF